MPADHVINEHDKFHLAIEQAYILANQDYLVTFGIKPTYAETGYGYIAQGAAIENSNGFEIKSFIEKPEIKKAEKLISSNKTFWNSGMFMFKINTIIKEFKQYQPKLLDISEQTIENYTKDLDFIRLNQKFYHAAHNISIDHAVMEKTQKAAMIPLEVEWSDIGNWHSLWKHSNKDQNNNLIYGNAITPRY